MPGGVDWHVGVIHATPLSIAPLVAALEQEAPWVRPRHLLDGSLLADLKVAERLTGRVRARMERLIVHLLEDGVRAVQLACSGFAPVVDELAADGVQALALARYAMTPAAEAVGDATGLPVDTGPGAAARHLREVLDGCGGSA